MTSLAPQTPERRRRDRETPRSEVAPSERVQSAFGGSGWNRRDKKIAGSDMTYVRSAEFPFDAGKHNFVPIFQQSRYKYLIYVEGHCAACRYGFMMRLGSVILKVESKCVADTMWFFPLLRPYVDHVPVRADLSDLADKIRWCRDHDAACKVIAKNASDLYETYLHKEGLMDYVQLALNRIAANFSYPPKFLDSPYPRQVAPPKFGDKRKHCVDGDFCARCAYDEAREIDAKRKKPPRAEPVGGANKSSFGDADKKKRAAPSGDASGAASLRARMKRKKT